jgi:hypothetical protein
MDQYKAVPDDWEAYCGPNDFRLYRGGYYVHFVGTRLAGCPAVASEMALQELPSGDFIDPESNHIGGIWIQALFSPEPKERDERWRVIVRRPPERDE